MTLKDIQVLGSRIASAVTRLAKSSKHTALIGSIAFVVIVIGLIPSRRATEQDQKSPTVAATHSNDATVQAAVPHFEDVTLKSGVVFSHLQGDEFLTGLNETLGPGACAFDYDNDGWVDLLLINGTGQTKYYGSQHWWALPKGNALFRNLGNGHFEDVTKAAGIGKQTWGMGCVNGDLDNDGDQDVVITNFGSVVLYRNNGDGTFTDISESSGLASDRWSTSATLTDIDGDGLLDIYVTSYVDFSKAAHTYESTTQFAGEYPRSFNSQLYQGDANRLFKNKGNLRFADIAVDSGVSDKNGRGMGSLWLDANGDGRMDLFVANDIGTTNMLFLNQGHDQFEEHGLYFLLNDAHGAHSVVMGDINNDGAPDLAASMLAGEPPAVLMNEPFANADQDKPSRQFKNRSRQLGIGSDDETPFGGWGLALEDFNNDGRLDLFQASGLVVPDANTKKIPTGQPKRLWVQQSDGFFRDASNDAGVALSDTQSARGIAVADFDNDGRVDIYVAHNNDLGQLLHNDTSEPKSSQGSHHWIGIKLVAKSGNRDAIGAVAKLETDFGIQSRYVVTGGFLSSNDRRLHFGWPAPSKKLSLTVIWPNGVQGLYKDLPTDRYVEVTEYGGVSELVAKSTARTDRDTEAGLKIAAPRAANRREFLQWSVTTRGVSDSIPELKLALHDEEASTRRLAVELLHKQKDSQGLGLLIDALDDHEVTVRLAAVDAIRDYEDEASIRWLLRSLHDPHPQVRAEVAEIFAYFYRKEEAVIYRKYLALPRLIKLLEDATPQVRKSAAHAIGEAKRFEGIAPLIAVLNDPDPAVRAEAVCSLGLIRDLKALDTVRRTLADESQPPAARAQALIALKRLNALNETELAAAFSTRSPFGKVAPRDGLKMLQTIFADTLQGAVLNRRVLNSALKSLVEGTHSGTESDLQLAVETLRLAGGHDVAALLTYFANDPSDAIRIAAFEALLDVDRAKQGEHFNRALSDRSLDVRLHFLMAPDKQSIPVSSSVLAANLSNPKTQLAALAFAGASDSATVLQQVYGIAAKTNEASELRIAATNALSASRIRAPADAQRNLIDNLLAQSDSRLRAVGIKYWTAMLPAYVQSPDVPTVLQQALHDSSRDVQNAAIDSLLSRHEAWAIDFLCKTLTDANAELGLRRRILDGLAKSQIASARAAILKVADTHTDILRTPALASLNSSADNGAKILLWKVLQDKSENGDVRYTAAQKLFNQDAKKVLEILRAG